MLGEEQLIEGCRKGDRTAQRQLYEKYSRRMFGICLRYCDSHEDAEEVLQEGSATQQQEAKQLLETVR